MNSALKININKIESCLRMLVVARKFKFLTSVSLKQHAKHTKIKINFTYS